MKKSLLNAILTALLAAGLNSMAFTAEDINFGDLNNSSGGGLKKRMFTIKGGYDIGGNLKYNGDASGVVDVYDNSYNYLSSYLLSIEYDDDVDVKGGFTVGFEGLRMIYENIGIGAGASYQFPRGIDEETFDGDPQFNFLPIYGLCKIFIPANKINLFGTVHLGYNMMFANDDLEGDADISGGVYWGLGGGLMLDNGLQIELLYSVNRGKLEGDFLIVEFDGVNYFVYEGTQVEKNVYSKLSISAGVTF